MIETCIEKVPYDDHPDQCQEREKSGPCKYKKVPGYDRCPKHSRQLVNQDKKERLRNYRLTQWQQQQVDQFVDNTQIKSLREEIGILRMTLQETLNSCKDTEDLLLYAPRIQGIVKDITNVIKTCHQLEYATGNLLDKNSILQIAGSILEIITQHVQDPLIIDQLGNEIIAVVSTNKIGKLSDRIGASNDPQ